MNDIVGNFLVSLGWVIAIAAILVAVCCAYALVKGFISHFTDKPAPPVDKTDEVMSRITEATSKDRHYFLQYEAFLAEEDPKWYARMQKKMGLPH